MALDKGLNIVARKEVCRARMYTQLADDFGGEAAGWACDELERLGLVDDRRYAGLYAERQFSEKNFYIRRVEYDLCGKGIDRELARQVCAELAPDQEEALAGLLSGRLGRDLGDQAGVRRTTATLIRYGYEPEAIRRAIRAHGEGASADEEEYFE